MRSDSSSIWRWLIFANQLKTAIDEPQLHKLPVSIEFCIDSLSLSNSLDLRSFFSGRIGMQDIHGILGGGAAGGSGGPIFGDRRMRAAPQGQHHQQAIKCPRCDSSNTKFCYYNNYNLSQPRHFCKNCRRYWTNGGVLRNVPVGGGCRKAKRSKRKAASPAPPHRPPPSTAVNDRDNKSNSRSSSESTSANKAAKAQPAGGFADVTDGVGSGKVTMVTESGSEFSSSPNYKFSEQPPVNYTVQEPTKPDCSAINGNFKPLIDPGGIAPTNSSTAAIFSEIGGFASFMNGDQNQSLSGFGAGGDVAATPFRIHHQNQVNHHQEENQQMMRNLTAENWRMEKVDGGNHWGAGVLDQTVQMDLVPNIRSTGGGVLAGGDWHGISGGERGNIGNLFDLTSGNSGGHWSQSADQWHESDHDHDHHLYLPP